MELLRCEGLSKVYGSGPSAVAALTDLDLSLESGDFLSVLGSSGSGKSTLLNIIGGLDRPTTGRVAVAGTSLFDLSSDQRAIFRRRNMGFIFQAYNLVAQLSLLENVTLPMDLDGQAVDADFVDEVLEILGLYDKKRRLPGELSGGQQQRVAIARALASKPVLVLADEPTGNLDSANSLEVVCLLKDCQERFAQTLVMITHDEGLAQMAKRSLRLEDGRWVTP